MIQVLFNLQSVLRYSSEHKYVEITATATKFLGHADSGPQLRLTPSASTVISGGKIDAWLQLELAIATSCLSVCFIFHLQLLLKLVKRTIGVLRVESTNTGTPRFIEFMCT
jgi:hypothetical protein